MFTLSNLFRLCVNLHLNVALDHFRMNKYCTLNSEIHLKTKLTSSCHPAGGAISNMYSVMIARYKFFPEVKTKGMAAAPRLVLFTSEHVGIAQPQQSFQGRIQGRTPSSLSTEPLLHQESQRSSGFWDRKPHPAGH